LTRWRVRLDGGTASGASSLEKDEDEDEDEDEHEHEYEYEYEHEYELRRTLQETTRFQKMPSYEPRDSKKQFPGTPDE
jgi:hypothetical protein